MLIDTHCHLDATEFDGDRDQVIEQSRLAGVDALLVPAVHVDNFEAVRALARAHPHIRYTLGIHPMYVDRSSERDLDKLQSLLPGLLSDAQFVGIGEIGLDHFVAGLDHSRQALFFERQLQIARAFDLPVILHVRRAQDQVLKYLRSTGTRSGIAHAFNGSRQQADFFLARGFALGFGGAMTFARALQIRRLAAELPAEAIVLETDAPDIAPSWQHPRRNSPVELPRIAATLAELRSDSVENCIRATAINVQRVIPRFGCQADSMT